MSTDEGYRELIESMIKEERRVVKDVALKEVREMEGIVIDEDGNIVELSEDGREVFTRIYRRYKELGFGTVRIVIKKAIEPVLEKNPDLEVPEELR
mgnify:CR=1 FL=1